MNSQQIEEIIELLDLFNEKVIELHESSFAKAVFSDSGVKIAAERGKPVVVERRGPSEESIRAWAPSVRLLIAKNERISFHKMHLVYAGLPIDEVSQGNLKEHRKEVETFLESPANINTDARIEPLKIDGQEPTVRVFLERFLYSDILHLDKEKRKDFVNWRSNQIIFAFAQNRFCFLSAHIINFAAEMVDFNDWIIPRLQSRTQQESV